PCFWVIDHWRNVWALYGAESVMVAFAAVSSVPVIVTITESLPARIRSGAVATLYAFAISIFGGSPQFVITWPIDRSRHPLARPPSPREVEQLERGWCRGRKDALHRDVPAGGGIRHHAFEREALALGARPDLSHQAERSVMLNPEPVAVARAAHDRRVFVAQV